MSRLEARARKPMQLLRATLQMFLKQRGFAFLRLEGPPPPTLREALRRLRAEAENKTGGEAFRICCLDSELQTQTDLLSVFPEEQVTFAPDFATWRRGQQTAGLRLLVVDAESGQLCEILNNNLERNGGVETILVRSSLGHFWAGSGDLGEMTRKFRAAGFGLRDALGRTGLLSWSALLEPVVFIYENERFAPGAARLLTAASSARVEEALTLLSQPLVRAGSLRRLAGRGSFGFASGVLNPGAVRWGDRTVLLARGERLSWAVQKKDEVSFATSARPLLMELAPEGGAPVRAEELALEGGEADEWRGARVEDFRLFRFREEIFSNCAITSVAGRSPQKGRALKLETLTTKVGLARFDPAGGKLALLGAPRIDRPTRSVEKNWAMFEASGDLHLIYSFNPYRLLRAAKWPALEFATIRECAPHSLADALPGALRNSINPVEYDEKYLLHVVHAVFPVKRYSFWAVLIDKSTLLPAMVSARPLVCGWHSAPASIIYVTAVVPGADEIEIYGGLNDSSIGRWTLRRECLDASWLPFA